MAKKKNINETKTSAGQNIKENAVKAKEVVKEAVKDTAGKIAETAENVKEAAKNTVSEISSNVTAKKAPASAELKEECFIEFAGKQIPVTDITTKIKKIWKESNKGKTIESLSVYVKPDDSKAYYVVNGVEHNSIDL